MKNIVGLFILLVVGEEKCCVLHFTAVHVFSMHDAASNASM